jgi:hypothetical protein
MVKTSLKIFLILIFLITLTNSTYSQNRKYFIITGKIVTEINSSDKSSIQIVKKDKRALSSEIPSNGRFRLELDYNSEYQLTFIQNGHLPKTIVVNTEIPEEVLVRPTNVPNFLMAVKLFKNDQDASGLYSGDQKQQIAFSTQQNDFARMPTILDAQYVDNKGNQNYTRALQPQEGKSKMPVYQVF